MAVKAVPRVRPWWWQLGNELAARLQALSYSELGKRDLRIDFLRGLAVSVMVVDHVGGDTILTQLSGGNQFIVSAAEGFVFLSGFVLGMVYAERIRRSGPTEAIKGLLQRASTLYRASVGVALLFLGLLFLTDLRLWTGRDREQGASDPVGAAVGILTLHNSLHGSDVLVMYTLMLAAAPAVVYLLHRGWTVPLLVASASLWGLYQRYPEVAAVPWAVTGSSFPVAAWQLLFVLGMGAGFHRDRLAGWLLERRGGAWMAALAASTAIYLLAWSSSVHGSLPLPEAWFGDATYGSLFAKVSLGPGRVVAFLAVAIVAYVSASFLWAPLRAMLGWLLLPLGQNSLYVYITHLFVLVLLYNLAPQLYGVIPVDSINLVAQVLALGCVWTMVRSRFLFGIVPR